MANVECQQTTTFCLHSTGWEPPELTVSWTAVAANRPAMRANFTRVSLHESTRDILRSEGNNGGVDAEWRFGQNDNLRRRCQQPNELRAGSHSSGPGSANKPPPAGEQEVTVETLDTEHTADSPHLCRKWLSLPVMMAKC